MIKVVLRVGGENYENWNQLLLLDSIAVARVEGGVWSCTDRNRNQTKKVQCLSSFLPVSGILINEA